MEELTVGVLVLAGAAIPVAALALAILGLSQLRRLDQRLKALEQIVAPAPGARPARPVPREVEVPALAPSPVTHPAAVIPPPAPTPSALALEQRIGARWATWIGVLSLIITVGLLLRWTFENNVIGPTGRVVLGLVAGAGLLAGGLASRRRDLPFLSEGLAGGGLAMLYLSLYAANTLYGLLSTGVAFGLMSVVTVSGIAVAVASSRQATAVLAVLGGLLTPILVSTEHPDERVLLAYLLVLGTLVLGVARHCAWIALNRLAWVGSVFLLLPLLMHEPRAPHPVARLVLLSALAGLFCAVPLIRAWAVRQRVQPLDLGLVVGNAAAYFSAVYVTLEPWRPGLEGPWALALSAVYFAIARRYKARVPEDDATVGVHLGNAIVLALLAFPLALDGPWVTLAWAAQGTVCLWLASRKADSKTALWGGVGVLALAVVRVVAVDPWWYKPSPPVWNVVYAVHLLVVAALSCAGWLAQKREDLRTALWFAAAGLFAILLWREPPGLWPAGLLLVLLLALAWLLRTEGDRAFFAATPLLAAVLFARLFVEDADVARRAAAEWVNAPFVLRIAACAGLAFAGRLVGGPGAPDGRNHLGRFLRGASGVALLVTLSVGWLLRQNLAIAAARATSDLDTARNLAWKLQVGLSVLWTLYSAAALAWGFVRRIAAVRYAALGLLGIVVLKVFLLDLAELQAIYRILSFLVLGLVLLGVSYVYQRLRPEGQG